MIRLLMEVEVEFVVESRDKAEVLNKIAQLVRSAEDLGLKVKEIEFEEEEEGD